MNNSNLKKKTTIINLLVFGVILVAGTIFAGKMNAGAANFTLREGTIFLSSGSDYSCEVKLSDITEILLVDDPDYGETIQGGINRRCRYGKWHNEAWGDYQLVAEERIQKCIVLCCDDRYCVFNYESESTTESLYRALREYTGLE